MRVSINAASAHMGGAVTYLQNVLGHLPGVAPNDQFAVYVPAATRDRLPADLPNVEVRSYPHGSTQGAMRLYFDQVELPRIVRRERADVLFSSTGFGTFVSPCPEVLLVRNMAYFDPEFRHRYRELGRSLRKNTLRRWHSLLSIRCADAVLFPTRAMQEMVERYVSLGGKATAALHYGFDHGALPARAGDVETEPVRAIRQMKEDNCLVLLSVSTYAVHKNFETLVEALYLLRQAGLKVRLVTTTSRDRTTDETEYDALQRRAEALGVRDLWYETGYMPYEQLGSLYDLADAYIFPSFTESFGHSMVEAMAAGLPLVAAGTPVNREVCAGAGAYFDTYDAAGCARVLTEVLRDDALREEMAEQSRRRAASFSWKHYTEELVSVFRQAASETSRPLLEYGS